MSRTVDDKIECLEAHRKDTLGTVERLLDLQRSLARLDIEHDTFFSEQEYVQ